MWNGYYCTLSGQCNDDVGLNEEKERARQGKGEGGRGRMRAGARILLIIAGRVARVHRQGGSRSRAGWFAFPGWVVRVPGLGGSRSQPEMLLSGLQVIERG